MGVLNGIDVMSRKSPEQYPVTVVNVASILGLFNVQQPKGSMPPVCKMLRAYSFSLILFNTWSDQEELLKFLWQQQCSWVKSWLPTIVQTQACQTAVKSLVEQFKNLFKYAKKLKACYLKAGPTMCQRVRLSTPRDAWPPVGKIFEW